MGYSSSFSDPYSDYTPKRKKRRTPERPPQKFLCLVCYAPYETKPGHRTRHYCSHRCRQIAYRRRQAFSETPKPKDTPTQPAAPKKPLPTTCCSCSASLAHLAQRSTRKYCSARCRQAAFRLRHRSTPSYSPTLPSPPSSCLSCSTPLAPLAKRSSRRFCSPTCRQKSYRLRHSLHSSSSHNTINSSIPSSTPSTPPISPAIPLMLPLYPDSGSSLSNTTLQILEQLSHSLDPVLSRRLHLTILSEKMHTLRNASP